MADKKLHQIAVEDTDPDLTDMVYMEKDPTGAQLDRKVQLDNLPVSAAARRRSDRIMARFLR